MDWKLILQIVGAVLGLLYLLLEYKASAWLWVVGVIMPCVHCVLYFKAGLYADFGMQVYYIAAGLWGLAVWILARKKERRYERVYLQISRTPRKVALCLIPVYAVLHAALYFILVGFTDSTVPFWDAMTTALSMVAMWMLSRKYTGQWLVWLAVDAITTGLYLYKGIPVTAGLYALYTVLAVLGYRKWLRLSS